MSDQFKALVLNQDGDNFTREVKSLDAKGVAVTIDSTHQCMTMRGIKKEQATTVTNYYLGQFKEDLSYQNRYLRFISTTLKD